MSEAERLLEKVTYLFSVGSWDYYYDTQDILQEVQKFLERIIHNEQPDAGCYVKDVVEEVKFKSAWRKA